jgi:SIR2-like domain
MSDRRQELSSGGTLIYANAVRYSSFTASPACILEYDYTTVLKEGPETMFTDNDEKYLLRAIGANKCVLFLGAGFSSAATNRRGDRIPFGGQLAESIWSLLKYSGPFDGSPLPDMFAALLSSGLKQKDISDFLDSHLLCADVPDHYDVVSKPYWNRIYTTNVDDLLPIVYRRAAEVRLRCIAYPGDYSQERDQSLQEVQAVYLNGRLPCVPSDLTFSFLQYAAATNDHQPLYDQFVTDYSTHPTIFVGTQLNEPLLWSYIQARQSKHHMLSERRPKSFLIDPRIPKPREDSLRQFNVVPIRATIDEYLDWLRRIGGTLPSRIEILKNNFPGVIELFERGTVSAKAKRNVEEFAKFFESVPATAKVTPDRSAYLMGATPRWRDLLRDLDAPRDVGSTLAEMTRKTLATPAVMGSSVQVITGSAGCGKSTILRRLGITLTREGHACFLTNSEELPRPTVIAEALDALERRAVLLFDNAEASMSAIASLAEALANSRMPPVFVIACRTNAFRRKRYAFANLRDVREISVQDLSRQEILGVLHVLDVNNVLGKLQGKSIDKRIEEFEVRASKQILVAMREATSGRLFDDIIRDEFVSLDIDEAKILYLVVALATDAGHRLALEDFVGCSALPPADTLDALDVALKDIVLRTGNENRLLVLRHRRIAEFMVDSGAPRPLLKEAYIRILSVLAGKSVGAKFSSALFKLYRALVNHYTISVRFADNSDQAREIYDSLAHKLSRNAQFWLQYGSLELQLDNLDEAENYLDQADSLDPRNGYVRNALGHLGFKRAIAAENRAQSELLRRGALEKLRESMSDHSVDEPHCYHIALTQDLRWIMKWVSDKAEQAKYLGELRSIAQQAKQRFDGDQSIESAAQDVERHYLLLATD